MSQQELLAKVIQVLDAAGIDYMVSGSLVSSLQGEPRSTHDIDFVVAIDEASVDKLAEAFPPPDFHLDELSIRKAIEAHGMFNLIDVSGGDKVDFWLLTNEPFDRSRFARRQSDEVFGLRIAVSSPEDTILMKLKWSEMSGGSEKQFTDALRVFEVQSGNLDMDYLNKWALELGVEQLFHRLVEEAESL